MESPVSHSAIWQTAFRGATSSSPAYLSGVWARSLAVFRTTSVRYAGEDEVAPRNAVCQIAEWDTGDSIDDGERRAQEQADLSIADTHIAADWIDQKAQHLAIGVRQDRRRNQNCDDGPGVGTTGISSHAVASVLESQIGSNRSRLVRGDPVQNRDVRRQSARVAQQRHLVREVVREQECGPADRLDPQPESNEIVRRQRIARERDVLDRINVAVGQARD